MNANVLKMLLATPSYSAECDQEPEPAAPSVSTAFFPGAAHTPENPDLTLVSCDHVFFYVHSDKVLSRSNNAFGSKWSNQMTWETCPPIIDLEESSPVLNLLLHTLYDLPCNQYSPTTTEILQSVDALKKYGFALHSMTQSWSKLYNLILDRAHTHPIEMYALAASHNLDDLAITISQHLLSFELSELPDEIAERMGAVYLKRLIFLHLGRVQALKRLLEPPPEFHTPTASCGLSEQRGLMRSWSLAISSLAWDVRPDLSSYAIEAALNPLFDLTDCPTCEEGMLQTMKCLISSWSKIKVGILYNLERVLVKSLDKVYGFMYGYFALCFLRRRLSIT